MKGMIVIAARLLLAIVTVTAFAGCKYRPMEGDLTPKTALIPVHIDWSKSGVSLEKMHRATVLLFPRGGGAPLEFRMETSLTDDVVKVPVGLYSVIVFNETTDPTDWSGITFTNKDSYEDFAAVGLKAESRGFYTRSDDDAPLIESPDPLAAWSLDSLEVTPKAIESSRSRSRAEADDEITKLTNIVPTPRFETMTITARVENLTSAMQATGVLEGMSSGVYMASGKMMTTTGAHAFILGGREYDDDDDDGASDDGTTTSTFNIFGRQPPTARIDLHLDFLLNNGKLFPRQSFDISNMIESDQGTIPVTNNVLVGVSSRGPDDDDHEIILPEDMDVKAGVTINDWDDIAIPIE
jgi:hypothetical protein